MICPNCNNPVDDNAIACPICGMKFVSAPTGNETTVLDQSALNQYNYRGYNAPQNAVPAASVAPRAAAAPVFQGSAPALRLAENRSMIKLILLSVITFGIYGVVTYSKLVTDLNIAASRYDGRRTMPYMAMCAVAPVTLGILLFVWFHNLSGRIGVELRRRGCDYNFGAKDYWLWNVLGSLILVGPFIYCHKLMKSMNMINKSFNLYG